jgi:RIP metalloprotease RseP
VSETLPPLPPPAGVPEPEGDPAVAKEPSFGDRFSDSKVLRLAILLGGLGYLAYVSLWAFALVMALVVSVFLHEMGHFLVAKRAGMKVTEFFLGFGPRIWSFRRGETEYGVKFIPAGAYVKIIGMSDLEDVAPEDEERSYRSQRFMKRMPVVLAGPAMNLAIGFLLLVVVIAGFGRASDTGWSIRAISTGSAAEAAGLQSGDRLIRFDGQDVGAFENLRSLAQAHAGTNVQLTVVRDGQELVVPVTLGWALTQESGARLGLTEGDTVTDVGGAPIGTYADLVGALQNAQGPVTLSYVRGTATFTAEVQ